MYSVTFHHCVLHLAFFQSSDWSYVYHHEAVVVLKNWHLTEISTQVSAYVLQAFLKCLKHRINSGKIVVIWLREALFKHQQGALLERISVILQHLAALSSQASLLLMQCSAQPLSSPFLFLKFSLSVLSFSFHHTAQPHTLHPEHGVDVCADCMWWQMEITSSG